MFFGVSLTLFSTTFTLTIGTLLLQTVLDIEEHSWGKFFHLLLALIANMFGFFLLFKSFMGAFPETTETLFNIVPTDPIIHFYFLAVLIAHGVVFLLNNNPATQATKFGNFFIGVFFAFLALSVYHTQILTTENMVTRFFSWLQGWWS